MQGCENRDSCRIRREGGWKIVNCKTVTNCKILPQNVKVYFKLQWQICRLQHPSRFPPTNVSIDKLAITFSQYLHLIFILSSTATPCFHPTSVLFSGSFFDNLVEAILEHLDPPTTIRLTSTDTRPPTPPLDFFSITKHNRMKSKAQRSESKRHDLEESKVL